MATYNGERFVHHQIETILPQLGPTDELVIADDSSTDGTPLILAAFAAADPRIQLFSGNTFNSPIFNFEFALQQARGEIIVLADQDDVWLPHKLATVRDCFARQPARPYLIVLDAQVVNEAGEELYPSVLAKLNAGPGFWKNLYDNRYLGCCMAFSRDLLDWALPFPRRIPMHDMWLGQLCERIGTTEFLPVVTMQYRKHEASLTEFRIRFMPWLQIKRRWFLLYYLLRRAGGIRNEDKGARITSNLEPRTSNLEPRTSNLEPRTSNLISIVMPCYQQAAFLEEAVRSVLDQPVDVELLVMDPGSTDGSRELLSSLKERYGDRLVLHFAPDRGQSDAVNRGMALARGTVLGWLNSDDRLRPGALARVAECLVSSEPSWMYGRAGVIDAEGRPVSSLIVAYKNWRGRRFSRFKLLTENFIPQMAVFWNRAMWDQAGELDIGKELDMDYDLWFRFARIASPKVLADDFADFRVHGQAKGSILTAEQLRAAYLTAREHAAPLGVKGAIALALHRVFSMRTRILYLLMKP
jgi:glycosyltransferase involved in cell wall biosynthesis